MSRDWTASKTPHGAAPREDARDERCACGALVARRTARGVELFCRRCKRVVLVVAADEGGGR